MRSFAFAISLSCVSMSAVVTACEDSTSSTTASDAGTGDSAPVDGGSGDASTDASLVPDGVTKIVVTEKGGGPLPPPPDGSTCQPADATYTIVLPARDLSWSVCEFGDGGPYIARTGQRTL